MDGVTDGVMDGILLAAELGTVDGNMLGPDDGLALGPLLSTSDGEDVKWHDWQVFLQVSETPSISHRAFASSPTHEQV